MKLDDFIERAWLVCDDGWDFRFSCDQWWHLYASCTHRSWTIATAGPLRVEPSLDQLYEFILEYHEDNNGS